MNNLLSNYEPISLSEMNDIKLMNRTDTKFVTSIARLNELLPMAASEYRVQETQGERIIPYYTLYFDTPEDDMYMAHHDRRAVRQKVRIRSYVHSECSFLEVKTKDNHKRTSKTRMAVDKFISCAPQCENADVEQDEDLTAYTDFLRRNLRYEPTCLQEKLENSFKRITLVNKQKTERLTIDTALSFNNLVTGKQCKLDNAVIIELKRGSQQSSPILNMLMELRIMPLGFSKYCIGQVLTDSSLKRNLFKMSLRSIDKAVSAK
jgi:hypothetical protein